MSETLADQALGNLRAQRTEGAFNAALKQIGAIEGERNDNMIAIRLLGPLTGIASNGAVDQCDGRGVFPDGTHSAHGLTVMHGTYPSNIPYTDIIVGEAAMRIARSTENINWDVGSEQLDVFGPQSPADTPSMVVDLLQRYAGAELKGAIAEAFPPPKAEATLTPKPGP